MFMVRVFILTLPYNVCIAQSTGAIARLFPSPWGEGRVRGQSLPSPQGQKQSPLRTQRAGSRAWPRSADSAGRPNQRLAFGGPPRTRPDVSIGPLWREPEMDRSESSGLRHRGGNSPSARRVGAPPGLRRCARLRPCAILSELSELTMWLPEATLESWRPSAYAS